MEYNQKGKILKLRETILNYVAVDYLGRSKFARLFMIDNIVE